MFVRKIGSKRKNVSSMSLKLVTKAKAKTKYLIHADENFLQENSNDNNNNNKHNQTLL